MQLSVLAYIPPWEAFSPESFVSHGETLASLSFVCFSDICCSLSPGHAIQTIHGELCLLCITSRRRYNWLIVMRKKTGTFLPERSSTYSVSPAWIYDVVWKGSEYTKMRLMLVRECFLVLGWIWYPVFRRACVLPANAKRKKSSLHWHWDMWVHISCLRSVGNLDTGWLVEIN